MGGARLAGVKAYISLGKVPFMACGTDESLTAEPCPRARALLVVAWIATLLASSAGLIAWRSLAGQEPSWLPVVHVVGLLVLLVFACIQHSFKPLRGFLLVLLVIFTMGFGGGWRWGVISWVRGSVEWDAFEAAVPWAASALGLHALRLLPALAVLCTLLLLGRHKQEFFLAKGDLRAMVQPSRLLGMKKPEPWPRIGTIFAVIFMAGTAFFLLSTSDVTGEQALRGIPLLPVVIAIAFMNGFNEEFTLRAAPLSELRRVLGDRNALLLTTIFFGLGHYYGVPNGWLGVLLSAFLGWFLGKSLIETGGIAWAWVIHALPDVIIFSFYAFSAT